MRAGDDPFELRCGEGWTIRDHRAILHSEPYASADLGAASDVTAKSVQSEAASASSPTPISPQLTSDVIAGTRGARVLWQAASTQGENHDTSQAGAVGRFSAGSLRPAQSVHEGCSPFIRTFSQPPTPGGTRGPMVSSAGARVVFRPRLRRRRRPSGRGPSRARWRSWTSDCSAARQDSSRLVCSHANRSRPPGSEGRAVLHAGGDGERPRRVSAVGAAGASTLEAIAAGSRIANVARYSAGAGVDREELASGQARTGRSPRWGQWSCLFARPGERPRAGRGLLYSAGDPTVVAGRLAPTHPSDMCACGVLIGVCPFTRGARHGRKKASSSWQSLPLTCILGRHARRPAVHYGACMRVLALSLSPGSS